MNNSNSFMRTQATNMHNKIKPDFSRKLLNYSNNYYLESQRSEYFDQTNNNFNQIQQSLNQHPMALQGLQTLNVSKMILNKPEPTKNEEKKN